MKQEKFCKDCHYFKSSNAYGDGICLHPYLQQKTRSYLVTAKTVSPSASECRAGGKITSFIFGNCGEEGKFYVAKGIHNAV